MHDAEPETFVLKTDPQQFCDKLAKIGVEAKSKEIGTDKIESGDFFSRYFSQAPRMITNRGCLEPKNCNIDVIQIIQKG
ncbi:MAG TPA: hypothetical protein VLC72_04305 [Nitrosopumilaceae archaeon]|nr:hypothetical protein [Nitrosopumilaceae archaeon]